MILANVSSLQRVSMNQTRRLVIAVVLCLNSSPPGYAVAQNAAVAEPAVGSLVEKEPDSFTPEEGFELLFNGRDLDWLGFPSDIGGGFGEHQELARERSQHAALADRRKRRSTSTARPRPPTDVLLH